MQDTTLTQDLLPAKKLTFVDATHELTQSVTEYERYFFPGTNNDNNKEKEEDVTLIKKAKKDPNAHSLRRYIWKFEFFPLEFFSLRDFSQDS